MKGSSFFASNPFSTGGQNQVYWRYGALCLKTAKTTDMKDQNLRNFLTTVLANRPADWVELTTHRLDIYEEKLAKTQFLEALEVLYAANTVSPASLLALPTAYDYIRLGHPLSCLLEWALAKEAALSANSVISFSSQTTPILAVLRKNKLEGKSTRILTPAGLPPAFDPAVVRRVYGYDFSVESGDLQSTKPAFVGSTILLQRHGEVGVEALPAAADFTIINYGHLGSVLIAQGTENQSYIPDIQHVRRRETIAMTPVNCLEALNSFTTGSKLKAKNGELAQNKAKVVRVIGEVTNTATAALVGSSGLSVQYAIMMGLVHEALDRHPGKAIKFIVPPNCYGGTNDQARRVAAAITGVEVVDLPVDGENDMVQSVETVLARMAAIDAVPYIIAEIPTNPRVEVPELEALRAALLKPRTTAGGGKAVDPVFILDQTFCPNVNFLGEGAVLSSVRTISYASGSKFPSGGLCTAGYCVANELASGLMEKIDLHLQLCDNEATVVQYAILAQQLPSMLDRIQAAYENTREFVNYIHEVLPDAKLNFVSEELAAQGFTPSVFSLDLPTRGDSPEEREAFKRALNHRLIKLMITEIPNESKYCVSYGQLKGCYWTIPATSTQGTTKEVDKDYIARVSVSPDLDLERQKAVFSDFVAGFQV